MTLRPYRVSNISPVLFINAIGCFNVSRSSNQTNFFCFKIIQVLKALRKIIKRCWDQICHTSFNRIYIWVSLRNPTKRLFVALVRKSKICSLYSFEVWWTTCNKGFSFRCLICTHLRLILLKNNRASDKCILLLSKYLFMPSHSCCRNNAFYHK